MKLKILSALFLLVLPCMSWADAPVKWEYAEYEEASTWGGYLRVNGQKYEEMKKAALVDDIGGEHTGAGEKMDIFNKLGSQGWELVTTSYRSGVNPCYVFKRPAPVQAP